MLLAGALALLPVPTLAQEAPPPTTNADEAVGPRELQNFNLTGTVTRRAEEPAPTPTAPAARQQRTETEAAAPPAATGSAPRANASPAPSRTQPREAQLADAPRSEATTQPTRAEALRQSPPASSVTVTLPQLDNRLASATAAAPSSGSFPPAPETEGNLAAEHKLSLLPWLLAALALGAGGAFLFWRNRSREAFAGGSHVDAFAAPEAAPRPRAAARPAPAPEAKAPPPPTIPGIVSTRLRPWVEIGINPLRCVLDDQQVTIEFELELFNSGSAPARAILVEASIFNASARQDEDMSAFFANPVGQGERIVAIPPLKRIALRTQVSAPKANIQAYDMGGRQVFVPLIAFNALYSWSGDEGQTSVSYLVGRDTKTDKMGPFRMDIGPRIFRGIAARLLPTGVRR